ncbi:phage tail fiber protein [Maridesulfovibrio sp.]|uniref:phage tail fiber protein n=1 Tax=Maridesulfovibrio sp. TaxID=2795000 RepID=UPI003B00A840
MNTCKSEYLKNKLADHVLRNIPFASPANIWLGLCSSGIIETDSAEVKDQKNAAVMTALRTGDLPAAKELPESSNYVRQRATFGTAPVNGLVKNTSEINFPQFTADVGLVTHFALFDAQTNGNVLYFGAFNLGRMVYMGDTFHIRLETLGVEDG